MGAAISAGAVDEGALVQTLKCHACELNWRQPAASEDDGPPQCPECRSDFVERLSAASTHVEHATRQKVHTHGCRTGAEREPRRHACLCMYCHAAAGAGGSYMGSYRRWWQAPHQAQYTVAYALPRRIGGRGGAVRKARGSAYLGGAPSRTPTLAPDINLPSGRILLELVQLQH